MPFDHLIPNQKNVSDLNSNNTNLDELIWSIGQDWKLDNLDADAVNAIFSALENDSENVYTSSQWVLKQLLQDSLQNGFVVQWTDSMSQLQKMIHLAGLDFNIEEIYSQNTNILSNTIIVKDGPEFFEYGQKVIQAPEREIIFELSSWNLNVFIKNDSVRNNDFIGVIQSWQSKIQEAAWFAKYTSIQDMTSWELSRTNSIENNSSQIADAAMEDMQAHRIEHLIDQNEALSIRVSTVETNLNKLNDFISQLRVSISTLSDSVALLWEIDTQTNYKIQTLLLEIWTTKLQLNLELSKLESAILGLQKIDGETILRIEELKKLISEMQNSCLIYEQQLQNISIMSTSPVETLAPQWESSPHITGNRDWDVNRFSPIAPIIKSNSEPEHISQFNRPEEIITTSLPDVRYLDPNRPVDKDVPDSDIPFTHPDYGTPNPDNIPVVNEVLDDAVSHCTLHNEINISRLSESEIKFLPSIDSKWDLLSALESIRGQKFPQVRPESLRYAFIFQVAISMLLPANLMGTIDAMWGTKSWNALKLVQAEILQFNGSSDQQIDGNPWKDTIEWLIHYLT